MKLWKKLTCTALCATMVGSLAACGGSKLTPEEEAEQLAQSYVSSAVTSVETAKSVKLTLTVDQTVTHNTYGSDETKTNSQSESDSVKVEIVLTEDGEGIALQVAAYSQEKEDGTPYTSVTKMIVKGNYQYSCAYDLEQGAEDVYTGVWVKEALEGVSNNIPEEMKTLINELTDAKEIEEARATLIEELNSELAAKILADGAADGKVTWTVDYAQELTDLFAYLDAINEEEDKLGEVINEILAEVAPGVTAEALLAQFVGYSNLTVAQALTAIDTALAEENTSLQGIYDQLIASEVAAIVMEQMQMDADAIAAAKAWKVDSLKAAPYGEMKLGELVNQLLVSSGMMPAPEQGSDPVDYVGNILTTATAALDMTFAELGVMLPQFNTRYDQLSFGAALQFNADKALSGLTVTVDYDMTTYTTDPSQNWKIVSDMQMVESMDLIISDISATAATIEAPTNVVSNG